MDLTPYLTGLRDDLAKATALADDATRATADRLLVALEPALRLRLIQALADAAAQLSAELDGDLVDIRMDGADPASWHLFARRRGEIAAYCRLVPAGLKFAEPSIGRVITAAAVRGTGLGRELMREALARGKGLWPGAAIRIGAQLHLERFYAEFGFARASKPYEEDGIPHIEMLRPGDKP